MIEVLPLGQGCAIKPAKSIDVIGYYCPIPVAEAKKHLAQMQVGEILELWSDDPETLHDLPMLLARTGHRLMSCEESAGEYRFLVEVNN